MRGTLIGVLLASAVIGAGVGVGIALASDSPPAAAVPEQPAPVFDCPNGSTVDSYEPGSRVLIVAIDASGEWLAIRDLSSPEQTVWVTRSSVAEDQSLDDLPLADCPGQPPEASTTTTTADTTTTTVPSETTTTVTEATTTTVPSETTTTVPPITTTAPDTTPPSISGPKATPDEIREEDGFSCTFPGDPPRQTTLSATVTDVSGVGQVAASWTDPDGNHTVNMAKSGDTYSTTIGPYEAGTWGLSAPYDNSVIVTITAHDTAGNKSSSSIDFTIWNIGDCFD